MVPFNDREAVDSLFAERGEDIAAVILEPVPANAGLYLPEPGFLQFLREITAGDGALLIFDEVMTGFRVARGGYQELCGVRPDLACFGKVIGGGLPVGALGGGAGSWTTSRPTARSIRRGRSPVILSPWWRLTQLKEMDRLDGWARLEEMGAALERGMRGALAEAGRNLRSIARAVSSVLFRETLCATSTTRWRRTRRPFAGFFGRLWNSAFTLRLRLLRQGSSRSRTTASKKPLPWSRRRSSHDPVRSAGSIVSPLLALARRARARSRAGGRHYRGSACCWGFGESDAGPKRRRTAWACAHRRFWWGDLLHSRLAAHAPHEEAALIIVRGTVSTSDGSLRVGGVNVIGVTEEFWRLGLEPTETLRRFFQRAV